MMNSLQMEFPEEQIDSALRYLKPLYLFLPCININLYAEFEILQYNYMHAPPKKQKQKSQLVFKLLKTMDPYHPQMSQQRQFIKSKLQSILQQQNAEMIHEEGTEQDQQSENSVDYFKNGMIDSRHTYSQLSSRVFNIMVKNGRLDENDRPRVKFDLGKDHKRELDIKIQWNLVRKQIESIQNNVFKKFNIYKQAKNLNNSKGVQEIMQKPSFSTNQTSKQHLLQQVPHPFTSPHYSTSSKISQDYQSKNRFTRWSTSKISNLRQQANEYQSPIKTYRHERQQTHGFEERCKKRADNQGNDPSNYSSTPVRKSKSSQHFGNSGNYKTNEKEKERKIFEGRKDDYLNSIKRKISEKAIKHMKDYDVQLMGSILQRKLIFNDGTNKISSLVK